MYLLNEEPIANFGGQIDAKTLAVKRGALDLLITVGLLPAAGSVPNWCAPSIRPRSCVA
jgi:hypothetical protein